VPRPAGGGLTCLLVAAGQEENGLVIFGWTLGCLLASFLLSLLRMEKRWVRWQKNERVVGHILQSTVGSNATTFVVPPA